MPSSEKSSGSSTTAPMSVNHARQRRRHRATEHARRRPPPPSTLVVGYDGSPEARAALDAARRRAGDDRRIVVVHVTRPPSSWLGRPYYDDAVAERLRAGSAVLGELSDLGDDRVSLELMYGDPADVLVRVAAVRDADEIVVGARRQGRLRAALGSVSHAVVRAADRPVLVETATRPARAVPRAPRARGAAAARRRG